MKKPHLTVVAVLLGLLLIATLFQIASPYLLPPVRWEYKVETIPDESFSFTMDAFGRNGWEAVSARRASSGTGENTVFSYEIIFKRPVGVYERKLTGSL